jgi:uncharacterized coiled-coil protein SlyX
MNPLSIYRLLSSIMRLFSATFSLARVHVTRATIGGRHSLPLLFSPSKSITPGARRFVGMVVRKKSTLTLADAASGGSGRTHSDLNVIGTFVFGFLGFYFAIKSDSDSKINGVESRIIGVESRITSVLESKLDGQDRKLDGHKDTIAAQERKVENLAEKIDFQYFKYILFNKSWSWFGLKSSPVKEEDQSVIDVVSKVADNLNTKFEAIHDATEKFGTEVNILGTEIETMRKELNDIRNKPNAKTKDGISSGSN